MAPDKITPTDPRIQRKSADLNGITYSYLLAEPTTKPAATIFLIHGWPDLALGWRYQVPLLLSMNLRVVVPDMMGYSHSSAPPSPEYYTFKRASDDLALLARQLGVENGKLILGGHDWGGAVVYRFAMWYPELIGGLFSVCTPFAPPRTKFLDQSDLPNFRYQKQLRTTTVEDAVVGKERIKRFLSGMYGGKTPEGEMVFSVDHGLHVERLDSIGKSPLLSDEEMEWYVDGYARNGLQGPLNWYRTSELNWEDEKEMAAKIEKEGGFQFGFPALFVAGTHDAALPPKLSTGMERYFKVPLKRGEVLAGHWALWQTPVEVNAYIKDFLEELLPKLGGYVDGI